MGSDKTAIALAAIMRNPDIVLSAKDTTVRTPAGVRSG